MPITLPEVKSGYNLGLINDNFKSIQNAWDEKLDRLESVQGNQMEQTIDMNSNRIINLPEPVSGSEPMRLRDVERLGDLSGYIPTFIRHIADGTTKRYLAPKGSGSTAGVLQVVVNGLRMFPEVDYSVIATPATAQVSFTVTPSKDDEIDIYAFSPTTISMAADLKTPALEVFVGDGTQNEFIFHRGQAFLLEWTAVYIDGLRQTNGEDYVLNTTALVFNEAPPMGSKIVMQALLAYAAVDTGVTPVTAPTILGDGVGTTFNMGITTQTSNPEHYFVFIDGEKTHPITDYLILSNTTIAFTKVPASGARIDITVFNPNVVTQASVASVTAAPPSIKKQGAMWYDTRDARLKMWYNDGDTQQWINV